ncbi:MAG: hypothetical protein GX661_03330 [Acholeplasmataceae bacterium]|nr:hypothetical protein [Acholeplasmataceae bacterium]
MDIQWFPKTAPGVVSIYETNITLNKVVCDYFKDAYSTLIGYDKSNHLLLIKSLNKEEATLPKYSTNDLHSISIKPTYGRINGKGIIKNLAKFYPLDFSRKSLYKFDCEWDASQKILKVNLEREVL